PPQPSRAENDWLTTASFAYRTYFCGADWRFVLVGDLRRPVRRYAEGRRVDPHGRRHARRPGIVQRRSTLTVAVPCRIFCSPDPSRCEATCGGDASSPI